MRQIAVLLIRLYPKAWRRRYGSELAALMDDSGCGWPAVWDVLKGALRMQFITLRFGRMAAACGASGLLLAGLYSVFHTPVYVSEARMELASPDAQAVSKIAAEVLNRRNLYGIIQDRRFDLYQEDRQTKPAEDVVDHMRRQINIARLSTAGSYVEFAISFAYHDPVKAQNALQEMIARFQAANLKAAGLANLLVIEPPRLPSQPSGPRRYQLLLSGLAAGLLIATILQRLSDGAAQGRTDHDPLLSRARKRAVP